MDIVSPTNKGIGPTSLTLAPPRPLPSAMKSSCLLIAVAALAAPDADAYSFAGRQLQTSARNSGRTMTMEYIPSGMSKEQWRKIQAKEKSKNAGKDLGRVGITSFKSRSFADWQKSGGKNLFPVDPRTVKDASEIPYMQRQGGSVDGADIGKKKGGFFGFGKKKEEEEPEPEKPKNNWWTLN